MLDNVEANSVMYAVLSFIWADYIWKLYLSQRQFKHTEETLRVPRELANIVEPETFEEAKQYSLEKQKFGMFADFFETLMATLLIYSGTYGKLWTTIKQLGFEYEEANAAVWTVCMVLISTLTYLLPNWHFNFVVEENFGFNQQTQSFFLKDELKMFIVSILTYVPTAVLSTTIVLNTGTTFFIWLWVFLGSMYLALMAVYPTYIAHIFDEFTPLPQGELRTEIEKLAEESSFPLNEIYVVKESKRSTHSNAYYTGLFAKKTIVIYDNMLISPKTGGCETEEILAVLAHEFGHWKLGYLTQKSILSQINLLFTSLVFWFIYSSKTIYKIIGFNGEHPVIPGLLFTIQYLVPHNIIVFLYKNFLAKKLEQVDVPVFNARFGMTDALVRALVKTHKDNLEFPFYDHLYSSWYASQVSLLERIASLETRLGN